MSGIGCSKLGKNDPRINLKSNFRSESFKKKIQHNSSFLWNVIIGCSKLNGENYPTKAFEQRNIETQIKI